MTAKLLAASVTEQTVLLKLDAFPLPVQLGSAWTAYPASDKCEWSQTEDGWWETGCGNAFTFEDSGLPTEHRCRFCMFCGKPLFVP